jgi:hypothetical protein
MEEYRVVQTGPRSGFVDGLPPNVTRLVALDLDDPLVRRAADLTLHDGDLRFAAGCLDTISRLPRYHEFAKVALWRASIVHYFKCFGDPGGRFQLDAKAVYRDRWSELASAFELFKQMRNTHIAHDESTYTQGIVGAALNNGTTGEIKVERVVVLAGVREVRNDKNMADLRTLIGLAGEWATKQLEELLERLKRNLNALPYSELAMRPTIEVQFKTGQASEEVTSYVFTGTRPPGGEPLT